MKECIFCKIIKGEMPVNKIYEDDKILAFLDIKPVNPGHTLVVPKEHFSDLTTTPAELVCAGMRVVQKIGEKIIKSGLGTGFNVGINTKKTAGQIVDHFHIHLMPRLEDDAFELWHGRDYTPGEAEKIAEKLKIDL